MKHRYLVLFAIVGLLVGGQVFAAGSSESQSIENRWETLTVTGKVSFKDWPTPEITSGRTTYELLVPRYAIDQIDVAAGDTITVEGVLVDRPFETDEPALMVFKAIIDGEEYEVPYGHGMGFAMGAGEWECDGHDRFGGPAGGRWSRGGHMMDERFDGGRGGRRF